MSNLLNAIAQSEHQHKLQSPQPSQLAPAAAPRRFSSWLLPAVLVAAPVAATVAYTQLVSPKTAAEVHHVAAASPSVSPAQAAEPMTPAIPAVVLEAASHGVSDMNGDGGAAIRFLPYPELTTEPLPSLNRQLASRTRELGSRPRIEPGSIPPVTGPEPEGEEWGLDELDYSELSPQLAAQLKSAIAATDSVPEPDQEIDSPAPVPEVVQQPALPVIKAIALGDLPASVQNRIPKLDFQTHIYSSSADSRWVKVNGREAFEGDVIAPGVTLRRIEPRRVVFDFESYLVEMPALSEW